jgi:PAS domain S-box-containing protein
MSSLPDSDLGFIRELDVLFGQSPIAMVFNDHELRVKHTNAAFRRLFSRPDEATIGRRPSETDYCMNATLVERTLADQVINRGIPVIGELLEQTLAGKRRILSWSAYPVTDNGQVLGTLGSLTDVTDRVQAVTALQQANARLDLLQRAGGQIGTTLDIHRTAGELAALAVPRLADRITIDLLDQVLPGKIPARTRAPAQAPSGFAGSWRATPQPGPRLSTRWAI